MTQQLDFFDTDLKLKVDETLQIQVKLKEEMGNLRRGFFVRETEREKKMQEMDQKLNSIEKSLIALTDLIYVLQENLNLLQPVQNTPFSTRLGKVLQCYGKYTELPT